MMRRTLLLLILALGLTGCGQSGPLYLPDDPTQIRTVPAGGESEENDREQRNEG